MPDSICALHNEVHLIARVYSMSLSYTACGGIAGTDVACLGCVCVVGKMYSAQNLKSI